MSEVKVTSPQKCRTLHSSDECKGEIERLRAENSPLTSAAFEVLRTWQAWRLGDASLTDLGARMADLRSVLATSKTPAPGLSSPEREACQDLNPGPGDSATTEKGKP